MRAEPELQGPSASSVLFQFHSGFGGRSQPRFLKTKGAVHVEANSSCYFHDPPVRKQGLQLNSVSHCKTDHIYKVIRSFILDF